MRFTGPSIGACALFFSFLGTSAAAPTPSGSSQFKTVNKLNTVPSGWKQDAQEPSADTVLRLHLLMESERQGEFESKLVNISTPGNVDYGKHFSKEELDEFLQPSNSSSDAVVSWLKKGNASPSSIEQKGQRILFHIKLADAEKLLNTKFLSYSSDSKANAIRTLAYSVPASIAPHVRMIQPTTRFNTGSPPLLTMDSRDAVKRAAKPFNISGYDCQTEITPDCIRRLYKMEDFVPTPHPKNKLGVSGYLQEYANKKDLATFLKKYAPKFAKDQFKFVSIENATNPQNDTADDSAEANLDVQYAIGLSNADAIFYGTPGHGPLVPDLDIPKPSKDDTEPYLDQLHYLLSLPNDELPSVLSTSYGEDEQALPKDYTDSVCHGFAKLGARGVSIIFSSGDAGPGQTCQTNDGRNQTRFNPTFPGACPYVTSVGGTHQVAPEEAATFSSGGFSDRYPQPAYQKQAVEDYLNNHLEKGRWQGLYNPQGRGFPDVAAQGQAFHVYDKGKDRLVDGTSASAPTFAAVVYNLNAVRLAAGKPSLGFLNPFLYSVGRSGLNDITHGGSKGCSGTAPHSGLKTPVVPYASWNATPGWDPVTGLGTPNFAVLSELVKSA